MEIIINILEFLFAVSGLLLVILVAQTVKNLPTM